MATGYKVAEAACNVTIPGVGSVLLYRGAPVPDSVEGLDQLVADGWVVEVAEEEIGGQQSDIPPNLESPSEPLPPVVAYGEDADRIVAEKRAAAGQATLEPADVTGAPAKSASKGEWVDYAVSQGASQDDAEASTKDDLIAKYGSA